MCVSPDNIYFDSLSILYVVLWWMSESMGASSSWKVFFRSGDYPPSSVLHLCHFCPTSLWDPCFPLSTLSREVPVWQSARSRLTPCSSSHCSLTLLKDFPTGRTVLGGGYCFLAFCRVDYTVCWLLLPLRKDQLPPNCGSFQTVCLFFLADVQIISFTFGISPSQYSECSVDFNGTAYESSKFLTLQIHGFCQFKTILPTKF